MVLCIWICDCTNTELIRDLLVLVEIVIMKYSGYGVIDISKGLLICFMNHQHACDGNTTNLIVFYILMRWYKVLVW